jgi:hypothetical protein
MNSTETMRETTATVTSRIGRLEVMARPSARGRNFSTEVHGWIRPMLETPGHRMPDTTGNRPNCRDPCPDRLSRPTHERRSR